MATTISVNDTLRNDQTAGIQDDDTAITVDLVSLDILTGLSAGFRTFLNALPATLDLSAAQLTFADGAEAAVSSAGYVTVDPDGNASVTDLFFSDPSGEAFNGDQVMYNGSPLKTVSGANIYFHSYEDGNIVLATTSATEGAGEVVAAFYLNETADHLSASVEMVTFMPIGHGDTASHDEAIDWTDLLNVSATGSLSFEFDTLKSGKFLWVAVGDNQHGLLVSGKNLNIDANGERVSGGSSPSDAVNTSQGGAGATMGIDNQMWTPGDVGVFTLVEGFTPLGNGPDATGDDADLIDYSAYTNVSGAALFISQKQGNTKLDLDITVFEAGGGTTPEEGRDYIGTEPSGAFNNDTAVNVKTVTINGANGQPIATWVVGSPGMGQVASGATVSGVKVTITGNNIDVDGVDVLYTINWTVADGETFNRFHVESELGKFDIGRIDIAEGITTTTPIGDSLFVDDDGPSVTLDLAVGAEVRVDESLGENAGENETGSLGSVTVSGATLFSSSANFGTDSEAADDTVYSLDLSSEGADSGMDDTASGQNVLLYTDGDDIVGRTATSQIEVLRISIDSDDGDVTVTQFRALEHGDPTDHDEADTPLSIGAGLVAAVRTIFDGDGDSDDDPADIGPAIKFEDDGPSVDLTLDGTAELRLDETDNDGDDNDVGGILASNSLAAAAYLTLNSASFGSDGAAGASPTVWSLGLTGANVNGVDCGLDDAATNANILLFVVNGTTIVGKSGSAAGPVVFTVSINATDGTLSVVQNRAIEHDDPNDHVEAGLSSAVMNSGLIAAIRTVTDGDGDSASDNVDVSQVIKFEDDGPSVDLTLNTAAELRLDETDNDSDDGDVGGLLASGSLAAAAYLTGNVAIFGSDGAAGTNPTIWSLSLTGADPAGVDCGLDDAVTNDSILLFVVDSTTIVGKAGSAAGPVVFTVTIDAATGELSVDQNRAIEHNDPNDHDEAGLSSAVMNSGLIAAVRTIFDGDGDSDSDNVDVSQVIKLEDDGPRVDLTLNTTAELRLDETDNDGDDNDVGGILASNSLATAAYLTGNVASFGSDGEAGTSPTLWSLSLAGANINGVDCGLDDASTNANILLFVVNGTTIVGKSGSAAGPVVFTVSIDATSGELSVVQNRAVEHDNPLDHDEAGLSSAVMNSGLIAAVRTITDGDGDSASDNVDVSQVIKFEDDGPSLSGATVSKRVEEDELSAAAADGDSSTGITDSDAFTDEVTFSNADLQAVVVSGSDTPASFAINLLASGAVKDVDGNAMTSKGDAITWSVSGDVVQAMAGGRIVFTVTKSAGGATADPSDDVFTVDLRDQIDHADASGDNGIETLDLTPAFVALDADGDAADLNGLGNDQEPIQLVVENDVPAITAQILDGEVDAEVLNDTASNSLNGAIGGDDNSATDTSGAGTKTYTFDSYTVPTNVWPTLHAVESADGTRIDYYESSAVGADLVYSIELDQAGAGEYTFTVHKEAPDQVRNFDFTDLPSGQNLHGTIANDKTNIDGNGTAGTGDDFLPDGGLLVFASNPDIAADGTLTNDSGTVNTSKGGGPVTIGNANQAFDSTDEGAFFCYVDNPLVSATGGLGLTQTSADDADLFGFNGTVETTKASVEIVQASGAGTPKRPGPALQITAYDIDPGKVGGAGADIAARDFLMDPTATDVQANIIGVRIIDTLTGAVVEQRINIQAGADNDGTLVGSNSAVEIRFILDDAGGAGTADDIYSVVVSNLKANYTIEFETEDGHDLAQVQHVSGSYDIGGFNIVQGQDTPDQLFDFSVKVTDYDEDEDGGAADALANFSVTVDGTGEHDGDPVMTMLSAESQMKPLVKTGDGPDIVFQRPMLPVMDSVTWDYDNGMLVKQFELIAL